MRDTIDMAREAGGRAQANQNCDDEYLMSVEQLEAFEALVRADEQEKYKWDVHSCGPTCKRYACVAMREAVEAEREACAKVCQDTQDCGPENGCCPTYWNEALDRAADLIRARGNT